MKDTNHKGNVAEMVIATEAMKLSVDVMKPLGEHTRYDLIFDLGSRLLRVQCKWATLDRGRRLDPPLEQPVHKRRPSDLH